MKQFKVNGKEYQMVDKLEEITLDQFYRLEDSLQNQYGLVDTQVLLNVFEILSNVNKNTLGDMDSETAEELTKVFTDIDYKSFQNNRKDLDYITINGVDYVFKKENRYSKMTLTERIHIDLIFKNINNYLNKGRKYKFYNEWLNKKNLNDYLLSKNEMTQEDYDSFIVEYNEWYSNVDLEDYFKFLDVKLEAQIDQNLTILSIMCQPGYSETDNELGKIIWKQHPFSNQNLNYRKELFRKEMKAVDGLKPIAFFLNGVIGSMSDSQYSQELKHQQSEEDTLSQQSQRV